MITAVLTGIVVWCAFHGRVPNFVLAPLCAALACSIVFLTHSHKHEGTRFLSIDIYAQVSKLCGVNSGLKFFVSVALMLVCVMAKNAVCGLFLTALMFVLNVYAGGLKSGAYLRLMALPVSFMMISGLALLFDVMDAPVGVLYIPVWRWFLCVTESAQARTVLVLGRALGALSCLYFISLTTPLAEVIGVLRCVRCPMLAVSLMFLTYRFIFVLLSMYHTMRNAAKSRLGYINYRTNIRTTGNLYANLLSRSYRQAGRCFDAMESRCFDMEVRFLQTHTALKAGHISFAVCASVSTLCIAFFL